MPGTQEYELVLMLDPEVPDEQRDRIAAEARQRIENGGDLKHDTTWGMRKMAYEIRQRTEADYRFFRFQTVGSLLAELDHSLKIADGVLRFRIFKVDPRSPLIVPPSPAPGASGAPRRPDRRAPRAPPAGEQAPAESAEAEPAPEAETAIEAPATETPDAEAAPEPETEPAPPESEPEATEESGGGDAADES